MTSNYTKCLRTLRPLNSKISNLRNQNMSFSEYQSYFNNLLKVDTNDIKDSSADPDSSFDHSLVLEDHVIPYSRAVKSYKRRRGPDSLYHNSSSSDEEPAEHISPIRRNKTHNTWDELRGQIPIEQWKLLNDTFQAFKQLVLSNFTNDKNHYNRLRLSEICSIEVGINIGMTLDVYHSSVEESKIQQSEDFIRDWYEHFAVRQYSNWVMLGHSIGILFMNLDYLRPVMLHIMQWATQFGLQKLMMELYVETTDVNTFYREYAYLKNFSETNLKLDFDEILIKYIEGKLDVDVAFENIGIIDDLIDRIRDSRFDSSLLIISKLIHLNCEVLSNTSTLVQTPLYLNQNQNFIIQLLSKFIEILNLNQSEANLKFVNDVYHSLKFGNFRSLIPVLKLIKLYVSGNGASSIIKQYKKLTSDGKVIMEQIFQRHYNNSHYILKITKPFLFQTRNHDILPSIESKRPFKRSKISTGDLI